MESCEYFTEILPIYLFTGFTELILVSRSVSLFRLCQQIHQMKPEHTETVRTVCAMVCAVPETLHHQLWCTGLEWHYCLLCRHSMEYQRKYCIFFNALSCRLEPPYKTKHCLDWTVRPSALKQLCGNGSPFFFVLAGNDVANAALPLRQKLTSQHESVIRHPESVSVRRIPV